MCLRGCPRGQGHPRGLHFCFSALRIADLCCSFVGNRENVCFVRYSNSGFSNLFYNTNRLKTENFFAYRLSKTQMFSKENVND